MTIQTDQDDEEIQTAFFRAGVAAQIGFIIVALTGVALVVGLNSPGLMHLSQLIRAVL